MCPSPNKTALVIFGVTGDLTVRKLITSLYQNYLAGKLSDQLHIIGFARRPWDDEFMKRTLLEGLFKYSGIRSIDGTLPKVTVPKLVKDGWVNSMGGKTGKQCSGYAIKSAKRRPQARLFPAKAIRRLMSRAT